MKKVSKKDFHEKTNKPFSPYAVTYEQSRPNHATGKYDVLATAYTTNGIGAREPVFYSQYKEKI